MNLQVCRPRQPATMQQTLQIPRFRAGAAKRRFWEHTIGGGGGWLGTGDVHIYICESENLQHIIIQKKVHTYTICGCRMYVVVTLITC